MPPKRKHVEEEEHSAADEIDNVVDEEQASPSPSKKRGKTTPSSTPKKSPKGAKSPKSPKSKSKKKGKSSKEADEEDEEPGQVLFESVQNRSALKVVIRDWFEGYVKDKAQATTELINFIIKSCGHKDASITPAQFMKEEIETLLKKVISSEYLKTGQGDYPIISKKMKKFKSNFLEFWEKLIISCPNKILYDDFFMESLTTWLGAFTNAAARPFRHTSTVIGLKIVNALITIANRVKQELTSTQRQLKTEEKKGSAKVTQLKDKADKFHQKIINVEGMMLELFRSIFVHRYRDITAEIRATCIEALGSWVAEYPAYFLEDSYLKYIGWMMNDRAPEVRKATLRSLLPLYQSGDLFSQMDLFTQRFKNRCVEMTLDKDIEVSLEAIKVCTALARLDALEEADFESINHLITDESCSVRHEVANFVQQNLFQGTDKPQKGETQATVQLRNLIEFISGTHIPEIPNYVIDALWGKMDILKNWSVMTDLLLAEDSDTLSDSDQVLLARIINVCVTKANGKQICPKTKQDPDHHESQKTIQANQENITKHFIKALPQLLNTFKGEQEIIKELIELPQHFELELYNTLRQKNLLKQLVKSMKELFFKYSEEDFLSKSAQTFKFLLQEEHALKNEVDVEFSKLIDEFKSKLSDEEDEEVISLTLRRLNVLYGIANIPRYTDLYEDVTKYLDDRNAEEVIINSIGITMNHILWRFSDVDPEKPSRDAMDRIATLKAAFFAKLESFLDHEAEAVKDKAFFSICDLLLAFSPLMRDSSLDSLVHYPTDSLQQKLIDHFSERTKETDGNTEDEERTEKFILAISRIVSYGCMSIKYAPDALTHYGQHERQSNDVLKLMISNLRSRDVSQEWKVMFSTLQKKFESVQNAADEEKQQFKELSTRLALTYGVKVEKELAVSLSRVISEGILYAFEEPAERFPFLYDGLHRFVSKLQPHKAQEFADFLQREATKLEHVPDPGHEEDSPYFSLLEYLQKIGKGGRISPKSSAKRKSPKEKASKKKGGKILELELEPVPERKKRKTRKQVEEEEEEPEEVEDIEEGIEEGAEEGQSEKDEIEESEEEPLVTKKRKQVEKASEEEEEEEEQSSPQPKRKSKKGK